MKRYQWTVLPQGVLCHHFVNQPLSKLRTMFPTAIIIHYMDDVLFAMETQEQVIELFISAQKIFTTICIRGNTKRRTLYLFRIYFKKDSC
jgi:hypothetical protein